MYGTLYGLVYGMNTYESVGLLDVGSHTDSLAMAAGISPMDSGGGTDALAFNQTLIAFDTGQGTVLINTAHSPLSFSDSGTGVDLISLLKEYGVTLGDSGAGVDTRLVSVAPFTLTDSAAGVDATTLQVLSLLADSGVGSVFVDAEAQKVVFLSVNQDGEKIVLTWTYSTEVPE